MHVPQIEKANAPDPDVAVGAILPLFRALLDGRLKREAPDHVAPARADEKSRQLPP